MPGSWPASDYRALLQKLEFNEAESIADAELGTYAVMAIQDLEPEEASAIVLAHTLGKLMTTGQIKNLSEEMKDDRKWEDSADMRCHEPIFNAQILLSEAFPRIYATPDIAHISARIEAVNHAAEELVQGTIAEPLLVRIMADGMPNSAVLKRLFEDSLKVGAFPEASQIIWQYTVDILPESKELGLACRVDLFSPRSWVGPLQKVDTFTSDALPD